MSQLKRKSPYGTASPAAGSVKSEDVKRPRGLGGTPSGSHYNFNDPRTVVIELRDHLKDRITMNWQDAYFHVQEKSPGVDVSVVLEMLKKQERVKFNENNQVYTYEPEIVLRTQSDLRSHIRTHARPTSGITYKALREAFPGPELSTYMENLEKEGQILILRGLTGKFKDATLPALGRENVHGDRINGGGPERWRMVFWDELKERNRTVPRVEDEMIYAWADVKISETDDVVKLLEEQDLKASSVVPPPPKMDKTQEKKKKRGKRVLKITNTHMLAQGIDFSKDYEAPS
ncbi:hypothetical protein Q8F55_008881 [Vanrija albida]|uniref:TFA2 Winged helix domain-containing protein n=1 Tax=Vanrija albida TaxID=181172 RepID=A0ABR3PS19_9TREE